MKQYQARILNRQELAPGIVSFWLHIPELNEVKPGQFFEFATNVRFLRRAISVSDREEDRLRFVLRIVGKGTRWLAGLPEESVIDIIGPLGQGTPVPSSGRVMLLGGGVGVAPLLYLARVLSTTSCIVDVVIAAAKSKELLLVDEFSSICRNVIIATDDGSRGHAGRLTDVLPKLSQSREADLFYACGPEAMLKAIVSLQLNRTVYAFLESRMGCGTGLCVGCAVKGVDEYYHRVCLEGPVFNLKDIKL